MKKIESEKLKNYLKKKKQKQDTENDFCFVDIGVSAHGQFVYVLGEPDHILYCFNMLKKSKKKKKTSDIDLLANAIKIHDKEVLCLAMHPHANIVATLSNDRKLKIWKP